MVHFPHFWRVLYAFENISVVFATNTYFKPLRQNFVHEKKEAEAERECVVISQEMQLENEAHEKVFTVRASYLWEMSRAQIRNIAES